MTIQVCQELLVRALVLSALLSAVPLGASLLVGVVSAVLQAATQIQEQTISFVPKLVAVGVVLALSAPWLSQTLNGFVVELLESLAAVQGGR